MSRPHTPGGFNVRRPPIQTNLPASASSSSLHLPATSRSGTPSLGRATISLEEWERIAPLSDDQLASIAVVKEKLGQRPLPEKFTKSADAGPSSRPSTPIAARPARLAHLIFSPSPSRSRPPSAPSSPAPYSSPAFGSSTHLAPLDPLHPASIATPQQFLDHFAALTLSTEHEQDSLYRDHLAEIVGLREKCDGLIELIKEGQGEVGEMLKCLGYVEERSESLRGACEDLLEEQVHLLTHTSQLAHRLTFFTFLESAQRMLNTPSNNLVLNDDFLPMVKRLEECLSYLGEHRDFKDAELYLIRYQQCMTRSMTLIKIYFVNTIKSLGQEVGAKLAQRNLSDTAAHALLYTKFSSLANSLRPLIAELETRVSTSPDDLASLLAECHSAWMTARQSLMGGRVSDEVSRMDPGRSDLVDLTRAGCSYLKQTCMDEFNLFKEFFLSGEPPLYGFLESLCDYLYDHLRPRILHEPSLEVLCGVCTVLQALMVHDVSDMPNEDDLEEVLYSPDSTPGLSPWQLDGGGASGGDYFSRSPRDRGDVSVRQSSFRQNSNSNSHSYPASNRSTPRQYTASLPRRDSRRSQARKHKPLSRLHTEVLLKMVLHDAQTRLVFRAQALISADVQYYAPKEGDLDYPEKLPKGPEARLSQGQVSLSLDEDDDDEPAFLSLPPPDAQSSWYPSLRVTLWVLSCLYSYVDSAVFEDLAQEAILSCRRSLSTASDLLAAKKDKKVDARLFLVRHLLILKEMTAGLELGRRTGRREWAGVTDFLRSLLENATSMLGYARGSIVKAADYVPDAKTDVDRELKRACEDLILHCTSSATLPLREFLDKCTAYLASKSSAQPTRHSAGSNPGATTASTSTHASGASGDLATQSFATPEKVKEVHDEFKSGVKGRVEEWKNLVMVYLQDEETVRVLIPPAQNAIVDAYRQFHDLVRAEYDFSTAASIMTPSAVMALLTTATATAAAGPGLNGPNGSNGSNGPNEYKI